MGSANSVEMALSRIRGWREQYRAQLAPSPLENINRLGARLDLTHAHPSGIAQLFASGQAPLNALFRERGVLKAAITRLERVSDVQNEKRHGNGVAELSLIIGVASWKGSNLPVLVYPVDVLRSKEDKNALPVIHFTGRVRLNSWFLAKLREEGVELDEGELFDGSNYESGSPDTSAVFAHISERVRANVPDFSIERRIVLGCFVDPEARFLAESRRIIDILEQGPTGNELLDALAGYADARTRLSDTQVPAFSSFDNDPHAEAEVGDVDNTVRYAAGVAASGHSLFVNAPVGSNTASYAAAVASRCLSRGKSVLYVPCVVDQKRQFEHALSSNDLAAQMLDLASEQASAQIDHQLIEAVGFQPGTATSHFNQLADELVGVRSRLTRYLGDLHTPNERWNVSAYQTIQNLASIAAQPSHPATRVRLSLSTARSLNGHLDEWVDKLERAGQLGEFIIRPEDTVWYGATLYDESEAVSAYQRVVDLLQRLLPATRAQVASTVETCGIPVPQTAQEWERQVTVLKNLRRVLDVFQPEIFERDIDAMIEASEPKSVRKAAGSTMGFWERRRHVKEAKGLLRVGAQVEDLNAALKVVRKQAEQWRTFVPRGGWPVLPNKLDEIIETQEALTSELTALDAVLATTPDGGNLSNQDFTVVEERLKALYDDRAALDTLPGRCVLERDFSAIGLDEFVHDLRVRRVPLEAVRSELLLSWWTTVFEDIVRSSAIISNQDGSALHAAADRFSQVDVEHVRSIGPMLRQEAMRRLCDLLFSQTQEANQLHTVLAGKIRVTVAKLLRDHAQIMAVAKPVLIGSPATLAARSDPEPIADVALIDGAAHLPAIEMLTILARARHVIVFGHRATITSPSVQALIGLLPGIELPQQPSRRAPQLTQFLHEHGYGDVNPGVATAAAQGTLSYHHVEANGVPMSESGLVESSQQEIDEVLRIIADRASTFTIVPADYLLTVVSLTTAFRNRLGAELRSLAAKDESMARFLRHVRLIGIDDVCGAQATDVILSLSYAKTAHGRLLQQFGLVQGDAGAAMLLESLAVARRNLDIVSAFGSEDLDEERLHQQGSKLLKTMLEWLEHLDGNVPRPAQHTSLDNVLFNDLAARIRSRGLEVAVQYGFDSGMHIPLVVGLKYKPFSLAVLTDDSQFMAIPSTRYRHRLLAKQLQELGWTVVTVWSVAAFVNPDKEVNRIVDTIGEIYREVR